jgi:hypothetical protein
LEFAEKREKLIRDMRERERERRETRDERRETRERHERDTRDTSFAEPQTLPFACCLLNLPAKIHPPLSKKLATIVFSFEEFEFRGLDKRK